MCRHNGAKNNEQTDAQVWLIQMLSIIMALKWQSARVVFEYDANKERGVLDRR